MFDNSSLFWSAFYQSSIGQVIAHLDGRFIAVNKAFSNFTGYTEDELLHASLKEFSLKEDYENDKFYFKQLQHGKINNFQLEKKFIHKNNIIIWGLLSVSLIEDTSSNNKYIFGQVQDITDEKLARVYLQKVDKVSVAAQLAAAVAHEIRNPLTSIKGFTQLQQKDQAYNETYTNITLRELQKIEDILTEYLALGNPLAETIFKKENIVEIMDQVITLLQTQANMANQDIIFKCPDHIPEIECNAVALKQTFLNIIKNALESMDKGKAVHVSVKYSNYDQLLIEISDCGCGITQERMAHIGEPFYSTKERGTGLGLMTSFHIIERHNGTIHIESVIGKGTTVTIKLPTVQHSIAK
ncbi:ATP-binding protein [Bacillus sp. Marseille-P3661]|uniref:ATP-binding protein n=1 Tax=Bacillus sp. Marseille-P3661 TaxID=1936234 RepID=UPI000C81C6B5|nr:ATP-binding protein [Bacillus sp. Marseille-P3661]